MDSGVSAAKMPVVCGGAGTACTLFVMLALIDMASSFMRFPTPWLRGGPAKERSYSSVKPLLAVMEPFREEFGGKAQRPGWSSFRAADVDFVQIMADAERREGNETGAAVYGKIAERMGDVMSGEQQRRKGAAERMMFDTSDDLSVSESMSKKFDDIKSRSQSRLDAYFSMGSGSQSDSEGEGEQAEAKAWTYANERYNVTLFPWLLASTHVGMHRRMLRCNPSRDCPNVSQAYLFWLTRGLSRGFCHNEIPSCHCMGVPGGLFMSDDWMRFG